MLLDILQWGGCFTGIIGSLLLAMNNRYSYLAWPIYIVSNGLWIYFSILTKTNGLLTMQLFFTMTSIYGFINWIIKPFFKKEKANV